MHGIANLQTRQIDVESLRDLIRYAQNFDGVAHDIEHAAGLETGRLRFVQEVYRDLDVDLSIR